MMFQRSMCAFVAVALISAVPAVSEAALAKKLGSRYGGTLSSNKSTRTQQLTADPLSILRGSTSTEYDPSVVRLQNIFAEEGFFITEAYVGMTYDEGETEQLISLGAFIESGHLEGQETGYLQVFYALNEQSVSILTQALSLEEGYTVVDTDGEIEGDNTHTMLFNYIAENEQTQAKYRLYADNGSRGAMEDSLVSTEDPNFIITDIAEANVAGGLGALIPLPAAVVPGLIGLAGVALVKKYRQKIVA